MKKGDKVKPKKGSGHEEGHDGMVMTIDHISDENAIALKMPNGKVHKWYVESELEETDEEMDMKSIRKNVLRSAEIKKFAFGNIREFDRAKAEETRTIEFIISSSARDRHDSILNMKGWNLDNFNRNPIVGYQHNVYGGNMCNAANPDDVLGPGRAFIEDDRLIGEVTFETKDINPQAEKIFRKVLNGTLRATSVGFLEVGQGETKKTLDEKGNVIDEVYHFAGQELLEFSIVNIPSNPEAVGRTLANHTEAALGYLMQFMPEDVSMRDVKSMTIQEVLDHVQGKVTDKQVENIEKKKRLGMRIFIMNHELTN